MQSKESVDFIWQAGGVMYIFNVIKLQLGFKYIKTIVIN